MTHRAALIAQGGVEKALLGVRIVLSYVRYVSARKALGNRSVRQRSTLLGKRNRERQGAARRGTRGAAARAARLG
jgi:hypothetical protein